MIRSMTGFGRAEFEVEGVGFAVEVRSVNHRHLDVSIRLPRVVSRAEVELRKRVPARYARGKVDVSVSLAPGSTLRAEPEIDREVAERYLVFAEELARDQGLSGDLPVATLLSLPGVARLVEHDLDPDFAADALREATDRALEAADQMRAAEGANLDRDLRARLARVDTLTEEIRGRAGQVVAAARERLRRRASQLREEVGALDEARLHQEVVIAADRLDVTEELVRLGSHTAQFRDVLDSAAAGTPVGRRLDFLLQELLREANTVGSKAGDAAVAHRVVDLKTELERIREQVQNVE